MRGGGLDRIQVAPKALETWTELTHFSTPGKAARWGVSGTGWRLVLSLGVRSPARALCSRYLGILRPRLLGMHAGPGQARVSAPRARGPPHPSTPPPGTRSQWLLVASPPHARQAGTGENKAGRGAKASDRRALGTPALPGGWEACPGTEASPESAASGTKYTTASPGPGASRGDGGLAPLPGLPTPCHRGAHSRGPAGVQPQFASGSRRGAGPLGTAEAAADTPLSFPPGDLGEGRGRCRTGGALLSLSPPALQRSASDCIYFAGHEAWGPVLGCFLLHLQRQCLLAPCAAQSRSLGRRRRPMQQWRAGAGGAGRAGPRFLSARPLGQSPHQDRCRGGSRPRARAARSQSARRSSRRAPERRARKSGPHALVRRVDPLCVWLLEGKS